MRTVVVSLGFLLLTAGASAQEPQSQQPVPTETTPAEPLPTPTPTPAAPGPMRMLRGARLFIESSEFGMALSAAILKKQVPVVAMIDHDKADFFVHTVSKLWEARGLRMVSVMHFEATVSITNRDDIIIFAHTSRKKDSQSVAENIAEAIKEHIEGVAQER